MKRLWKALPIWALVILIILVIGGGVYAYVALTATGEITVEECLSFVGPSTFSVTLYPGEGDTVQLTVANASSVAIDVDLVSTITPDPGPKGLTVDIPKKITAPASGQVTLDIDITAGKSAEPDTYSVSIEFAR